MSDATLPPPPPPSPPPPPGGGYGQGPYGAAPGPKPDNHLVWAILSTVFCCLPVGIASIVYAAQVDGKWAHGDYQGAREASEKARQFAILSAGLALGLAFLWLLVFIAAGA